MTFTHTLGALRKHKKAKFDPIPKPKAETHNHEQFNFRTYAEEVCTRTFKIPNNKFALRLYGSYKAIGKAWEIRFGRFKLNMFYFHI